MLMSKPRSGINADRLFEGLGTRGWGLEKKENFDILQLTVPLFRQGLDFPTLDSRLFPVL
jgi:hypothetical protein